MKRRQFVAYSGLGVASFAFAACGNVKNPLAPNQDKIDLGKVEKDSLTLGFVPSNDAAPLIVATQKGFFERYGLKVTLKRFNTWGEIESGLLGWQLDAAQTLYAMPLLARLGKKQAAMISLMNLNGNGSAITLSQKLWRKGIRPGNWYVNFNEFTDSVYKIINKRSQPLVFATEADTAIESYLYRYWWASMGLEPGKDLKLETIAPSQLIHKLQAGTINGYGVSEPWNQLAVTGKLGFIPYLSRDIWKGHPNKVLGTMQGWADKYPTSARALVAALIEACRWCDVPENRPELAQILSGKPYVNQPANLITGSLGGDYKLEKLDDGGGQSKSIPDMNIYNYRSTNYLKPPDNINYPWRSQGIWVLTQMIRWGTLGLSEYPADGDKIIDKTYPVTVYKDAAKHLNIPLPKERMRKEPGTSFIDGRGFDPSEPVAYLNQFEIRST
ncbi:MAG: Bicarbonate transport ATP-binding protein CmpC [Chroococcopsis gigantea SAG 12.99]|jgi:nitrate/nitrite transport system substrate-binding protein|nr:ABC transporter substrate-binding protein [Chlorogloea purpurea SAG 13.99]MDV3000955.1 Bicarbonate transport ATP-binding protein CmpC [Chroococcopsis gigantea SAG 12.99]